MNHQSQQHFPFDRWDQSTYLQGLPNSNNVFPDVFEGPNLPQGVSRHVASELRRAFQDGLEKTPVHNIAYNMMSVGGFVNPMFTEAVYYATNLMSFIITSGGTNANEAFRKAIDYVYKGYLAVALSTHQHVIPMLNQNVLNGLYASGEKLNGIRADVDALVNQARQGGMNGGFQQGGFQQGGYQNDPMQGMSHPLGGVRGGQQAGYSNNNQYPPQSMAPARPQHQSHGGGPRVGNFSQGNHTEPSNTGSVTTATARYAQTREPQNESVIQSWSSDQNTQGGGTQQMNYQEPQQPQQFMDDRNDIPQSIDEVVFDPYHYVPPGVEIDPERPYDVIYIPGGSRLELAHKSKQTVSQNDITLYPICVQPDLYCLYHLIFPDGFVQEYRTEWKSDMLYIEQELNTELRGTAVKSDGKLTTSSRLIAETVDAPVTKKILISKYGTDLTEEHVLERPVFLEGIFTTSSRVEDEETVRDAIIREFDWKEPSDSIPSHIYLTEQLLPIEVGSEAENRLFILMTADSLMGVARGMEELLKDELIPLRVYRLINERFTNVINTALHDNLSIEDLRISNFVNDFGELMDVLRTDEEFDGVDKVLESKTEQIIKRAMTLRVTEAENDDEEDLVMLVDNQINYRCGFELVQLANLLKTEEPRLVSEVSSPNLARLIKSFIDFAKKDKKLDGIPYLITSDGVYIEILAGWLGSGNFLVKRLA